MKIADVIVDISNSQVDKVFCYLIPEDKIFNIGDRVLVPFGNRKIEGYIIDIVSKDSYDIPLKEIISRQDDFIAIKPEHIELMKYMKENLKLRYIDSLRLFLPNKLRGNQIHELVEYIICKNDSFDESIKSISKRAKKQQEIVEYFKEIKEESLKILKDKFSISSINALIDANVLDKKSVVKYRRPYDIDKDEYEEHVLTKAQSNAIDNIIKTNKRTTLLKGVTGSGKTEVYIRLIQNCIKHNRNAILLVPEISLTPQTLSIFKSRFGDNIALLHSRLSDGERFDEWRRIHFGECQIVIGARSAIFAPIENVGMIIIDEEHDSSYSSDSNPRYKTVDIAEFRAEYNNAKVVLGTATPSVESYYFAKEGQYNLVRMDERTNAKPLPTVHIVDMAKEIMRGNNTIFSHLLINKIQQELDNKNQIMIFLNRRGYSSYIRCASCGYTPTCKYCDSKLTYHKKDNVLVCHYCDRKYYKIDKCPECGKTTMRYGRIGTQGVEEKLHTFFPNARLLRMDSDSTSKKDSFLEIIKKFQQGEADILFGTQMIAKGHDFPNVTLVGILDADMGLYVSDYKANERTFQLITQVSGRAGRSEKPGEVVLQTFQPRNYVINYSLKHDYDGFFENEIKLRETTCFPPFSTMLRVLVISRNSDYSVDMTKLIYTDIKNEINQENFIYIQASRTMKEYIDGKYRYHILMRIDNEKSKNVIDKIYEIVDRHKSPKASVFIELDPKALI